MSFVVKVKTENDNNIAYHPIGSMLYGVCPTQDNDPEKTVNVGLTTLDNMGGITIHVKFEYANGTSNPTLNVDGTGALPIYRHFTNSPGEDVYNSWDEGSVISFTYDASEGSECWRMNDAGANAAIINKAATELSAEATSRAAADTQLYSRIAPDYDATKPYRKNDLVIYQQQLYRCKNDITTAEAWNSARWEATTVAAEREYKLVFDSGDIGQIGVPSSATIAAGGDNTGVLNPELNLTTYEAVTQTSESFTFNGTKWIRTSTSALLDDLSQFGITWPEGETPAEGDTISVTYVAGTRPFVLVGTYNEYPYRAAIDLPNVRSTMVPEVIFGLSDAISGLYAPISEAYDGGVYIYATNVPPAAITIPTIICWG